MKRVNNLYEKIISLDNLRLADEKARKGKLRSYGVRKHDLNRETNILALHEALKAKTFHTSKYSIFTIKEPKEREIYRLPYYPDRIVHHAIMNVIEPLWRSVFTYNTYSCIKGRGIHACMRRVDSIIRSFNGRPLYCLKIDIRKFYPSVNHEVMKSIVRRKIKDCDTLWLLDEIIDSTDGLPIGNYLSQHLSNLYLAYFMHWVNEVLRIKATEYADDIVFFADSKEELYHVLGRVREYIREELALELKGNEQIFPLAVSRYDPFGRGLDYVGYTFYREQRALRKTIKQSLCRRVKQLNKYDPPLCKYKRKVCAWLGWTKYCDSRHLLLTIFNQERYESIFKRKAAIAC